ncbi:TerD family protein [Streptomyces fagopyri]
MLNLTKDQAALPGITTLQIGVAWKTSGGGQKGLFGRVKRAVGTDLDLTAVALEGNRPKRLCWFDNTDAFDNGALIHLGDNRTGRASGDDETIIAHLNQLPPSIDTLVFIVSAFKPGVSFANIEGITLNLYNGTTGEKTGEYMPDVDSRHNACVMARAQRTATDWTITAINEMGQAASRDQLLLLAKQHTA